MEYPLKIFRFVTEQPFLINFCLIWSNTSLTMNMAGLCVPWIFGGRSTFYRQGLKITRPEEMGWRMNYIDSAKLEE